MQRPSIGGSAIYFSHKKEGQVDLAVIKGFRKCKVKYMVCAKWEYQPECMNDGYLSQRIRMDLNIPNVEELLILYEINSEFKPLQVVRIYLSQETMAPQWRVR